MGKKKGKTTNEDQGNWLQVWVDDQLVAETPQQLVAYLNGEFLGEDALQFTPVVVGGHGAGSGIFTINDAAVIRAVLSTAVGTMFHSRSTPTSDRGIGRYLWALINAPHKSAGPIMHKCRSFEAIRDLFAAAHTPQPICFSDGRTTLSVFKEYRAPFTKLNRLIEDLGRVGAVPVLLADSMVQAKLRLQKPPRTIAWDAYAEIVLRGRASRLGATGQSARALTMIAGSCPVQKTPDGAHLTFTPEWNSMMKNAAGPFRKWGYIPVGGLIK